MMMMMVVLLLSLMLLMMLLMLMLLVLLVLLLLLSLVAIVVVVVVVVIVVVVIVAVVVFVVAVVAVAAVVVVVAAVVVNNRIDTISTQLSDKAASTAVQQQTHPRSERTVLAKHVPPPCGRVAVVVAVVALLLLLPSCGCCGSLSPSAVFHSLAATGDMLHHCGQNLTCICTATRDSAWSQDGRTPRRMR